MRALAVATKRSEVFLLNRETGEPLSPVEQRPVPQKGKAPEERLSSTQPFPTDFPSLFGEPLREADMWGLTPFDHIWCRIRFLEARYEGTMTPPGMTPSINDPGQVGGYNWGSASLDGTRNMFVAITARIPYYTHLVRREDPYDGRTPMIGTPYAAMTEPFLSPLRVPCNEPPWGRISGVDIAKGRLVWSRPIGTGRDSGPFGIASRLDWTIGTPAVGGVVSTESGLSFTAASTDRSVYAYETTSGRLLWKADLPFSGSGMPMTYRSRKTGRQYLVVPAAGDAGRGAELGDQIVAFALPRAAHRTTRHILTASH